MKDPDQLTTPPDGKPEKEQPRWRRDFPIDWPQDDYISRRDFTGFMVLTSIAFVAGKLWILVENYLSKKRGKPQAARIIERESVPVGGSHAFTYPDPHTPCILVRPDENTFLAYDQQCTHLTCPVIPKVAAGRFHCPCHEGSFDMRTGQPLAGPPRRALRRVRLETRDGVLYANGFAEEAS